MKQKKILLLVLIAGLTACTKDDGDNIQKHNVEFMDFPEDFIEKGEYEGEWILNQEKIDTAMLIVTNKGIIVEPPSEQLIKYAAYLLTSGEVDNNLPNKKEITLDKISTHNVAFEVSNDYHNWLLEAQGRSSNQFYFTIKSSHPTASFSNFVIAEGKMYYIDNNVKIDPCHLSLFTNEPILAVFDRDTNLWVIQITLNKLYYQIDYNDIIVDLESPLELIYVATKKVRNIESN